MHFVDDQQFQALEMQLKIKQAIKIFVSNRDKFSFSSWLSCHNVPFFWRCHNYLGACNFGPRQLHITLDRVNKVSKKRLTSPVSSRTFIESHASLLLSFRTISEANAFIGALKKLSVPVIKQHGPEQRTHI